MNNLLIFHAVGEKDLKLYYFEDMLMCSRKWDLFYDKRDVGYTLPYKWEDNLVFLWTQTMYGPLDTIYQKISLN